LALIPLAAAAAGLLALSAAAASPAAVGAGDVSVEAGNVSYQADTGSYRLEDGVVLRRGLVTLRARSATYDPTTGAVHATGDVLLTDARRAVAADGMTAVLGGAYQAEHVIAFLKEGPVELGSATTIEEARRRGRNRLTFTGERLEGDGTGRLRLGGARLTLCDCGGGAPSWELRAGHAGVVPGHHATLSWPVLYVTPRFLLVNRPVPVLILPWIFLPLGERQTGLLLPVVGSSTPASGFSVAQPVFVTLGRSADATVTPEYLFGRKASEVAAGNPAVRGFGARMELRWVPAADARGEVELHAIHDLDREPLGAGGWRLGVEGAQSQRLLDHTLLGIHLALASDPVWFRDATGDVLLRTASYRRSSLLVSRGGDALVLEAGAAYHQPLTPNGWGVPAGATERPPYGVFGAELPVFHRWPSLSATLLPRDLGPLSITGRAGLERYAPASGDARGGFGPGDPGAVRGLSAPEREGVTRLDARAEISAPVLLGGALGLTPYLRGAALGYAFDTGRDPARVAWGVAGAAVSTELSRAYGGTLHRIAPRLELRAGTRAVGGDDGALPFLAYDAWDRVRDGLLRFPASAADPGGAAAGSLSAAPGGAFQQLRLALENRLDAGKAGSLRLEVGQDLDVRAGRMAETFFSGTAARGRLSADLSGRFLSFDGRPEAAPAPRFRSWLDHFTELRAGLSAADPRGDQLHAGLLSVGPGASGALMAGVDTLFDLRSAAVDAAAQGSAGVRVVLGGGTLGYDALFTVRPIEVGRCRGTGTGTRQLEPWHVQQHSGSFIWDSPCHCFLARLAVRVNDCGERAWSAAIDLARMGERAVVR
jgi:LPS-assembly protein